MIPLLLHKMLETVEVFEHDVEQVHDRRFIEGSGVGEIHDA